jgi:hypothetical protein
VSTNLRIGGNASDLEVQVARDACVTSAMEEAVEKVLRHARLVPR